MAKQAKARTSKKRPPEDDFPKTDDELMERWFAEIRRELQKAITPYIEGPLRYRGNDGFPLNLGDGPEWYRAKDGLSDKAAEKLFLLIRAAIDTSAAEGSCKYGQRIPTIFGCALRIGQFTERVNVVLNTTGRDKGIKLAQEKRTKMTVGPQTQAIAWMKELIDGGSSERSAYKTISGRFAKQGLDIKPGAVRYHWKRADS